jgi:uncharacterized protein YqeY
VLLFAMTSIESRVKDDIKVCMKAGRKDELELLRMLMAEVKNAAIRAGGERTGVDDDTVLAVIRRGVKTRTESAETYAKVERPELEKKERFQIEVLRRYLPADMSDAEVEVIVDIVIVELEASTKKDMGRVIKEVMSRTGGRVDGGRVAKTVGGRLS